MLKYKTRLIPDDVKIKSDKDYELVSRRYDEILNEEAANGWKLHSIDDCTLNKKGEGFGAKDTETHMDILIFYRED
jgi:hypothetical protein